MRTFAYDSVLLAVEPLQFILEQVPSNFYAGLSRKCGEYSIEVSQFLWDMEGEVILSVTTGGLWLGEKNGKKSLRLSAMYTATINPSNHGSEPPAASRICLSLTGLHTSRVSMYQEVSFQLLTLIGGSLIFEGKNYLLVQNSNGARVVLIDRRSTSFSLEDYSLIDPQHIKTLGYPPISS